MKPKLSLIISFYNKIELLKLVFASLERQTFNDFEVVIADDGSKQEVVDEIQSIINNYHFPIRHVWHEDDGWQKNKILNKAVVQAMSDYLVFLDGDCIPHPMFLQEHFENKAPNQVISGRRVMLTEKTSKKLDIAKIKSAYLQNWVFVDLLIPTLFCKFPSHVENMLHVRNKWLRKIFIKDKPRGFWGCNFSLHKSDILKVNGFDERYAYPGTGEDTDLEDRLKRVGVHPLTKKHMVIQFHYYHVQFNTDYEPNKKLRAENNANGVTYTQYGINKSGHEDRV
jgi:glycosyltransferase involved in cell wall biosynthesis